MKSTNSIELRKWTCWFVILMLVIGAPFMEVRATSASGDAQVSRARVAVAKAETVTMGKVFEPKAATKLLNVAVNELAKVKKLGKAYNSVYVGLEKRAAIVKSRISQRSSELARVAAAKAAAAKAVADKAAAVKAAEKAVADKAAAVKAAEKAAADKLAADKAVADNLVTLAAKGTEVHGFYSGKTVYDSKTEEYLKGLTSVSFIWHKLESVNGAGVLNDKNTGDDFYVPEDYSKVLRFCKDNSITTQLAVYGEGNVAKAVMMNDTTRKDLIDKLLASLTIKLDNGELYEFGGLVVDFEGFRQEDTKQIFNKFLGELRPKLKDKGKRLYVAVNVLENYKGYDYTEILKQSDKVILMAHDYAPKNDITKADVNKYLNYDSSNNINSYAPIGKVHQALVELAGSVSQKSELSKIWLQISFGAVQWQFEMDKPDGWASLDPSVMGTYYNTSSAKIQARVENKDKLGTNFVYGYIDALQSPYMTYYNTGSKTFNFILYEDNRSVAAKINLTKELGIGGISLWRLGIIPLWGTVNKNE